MQPVGNGENVYFRVKLDVEVLIGTELSGI
jgi:hypothetical protein